MLSTDKLDQQEKILCATYSLFFKEEPNFKEKDHAIKAQIMVSILNEYGIVLDEYYRFWVVGTKGLYPSSIVLNKVIYDLSKKEIDPKDYEFDFNEQALEKITIISEEINNYTKSSKDEMISLIRIGRIAYFMESNQLYIRRYKEMVDAFKYEEKDIDDCIAIVNKLSKR